jgi:hypothetical protein
VAQALRSFNPNEHLIKLKSKAGEQDYLPVKWRLVWFRSVHPEGTIDTEEKLVDLDRVMEAEAFVWNAEKRRSEKVIKQAKGYARFKAIVTTGKGGRATGHGAQAAVDFSDYVEKAETKSIGRALAALGFGTQFTDEEFYEGESRVVDSPVETRNNPPASSSPPQQQQQQDQATNENATEQQISSIRKLCTHLGKSEPEHLTSISFHQAGNLIRQLTAEYKEQRQNSKAS